MMGANLKGTFFALEALIAIAIFFAVFSLFIVSMSAAGSTMLEQESALGAGIAMQAQVQHAVFIIDSSSINLSIAEKVLTQYLGNDYSLVQFDPARSFPANNSQIRRILTIDGVQYTLVVDKNENETPN